MGKSRYVQYWRLGLALLFLGVDVQCRSPKITGTLAPNRPPETRLSNIPPENDSSHPYPFRLSFTWDGSDEDGVVVGFRYRLDDRDWVFTTNRTGVFGFASPDSVNRHTFEIKAIDDAGAEDPTPARRTIFTSQNLSPETEIIAGPLEGVEVFSLPVETETWHGIEFQLKGSDSDGTVIGFEYTLDDTTRWTFIQENVVRLFGIAEGPHTFFARAVDDANGVALHPAQRRFTALNPTFDNGILIIDETRDGSGATGNPSDEQVDRFYRNLLAGNGKNFEEWDVARQGPPAASDLARYALLLWHGDDRAEQRLRQSLDLLRDYLNVGGDLWLVGWRVIPALDNFTGVAAHVYQSNEFGQAYLHLTSYHEQAQFDFTGVTGISGYPELDLDATKLLDSFGGKLNFVGVMIPTDAEPILTFKSATGSSYYGQPCATKYIGRTFKIIAFAFPFYYMNEAQAIAVAGKVLSDLGE